MRHCVYLVYLVYFVYLVNLVYFVYLVCLVYFVYLVNLVYFVYLVYLVYFVLDKDRKDQINQMSENRDPRSVIQLPFDIRHLRSDI